MAPPERINPETGIVEEAGLFGWREKSSESGTSERVNPDTGVKEERSLFGWREKPTENAGTTAERVNPDTFPGPYGISRWKIARGIGRQAGRTLEPRQIGPALTPARVAARISTERPAIWGHASDGSSQQLTLDGRTRPAAISPDLRPAMADVGRGRLLQTIGRAHRSPLRCTAGRVGRVIRSRFRKTSSSDSLDSYPDHPQSATAFAAPIGTTFPPGSHATRNRAHFSSASLRPSK